jgi:hypothetical protein
MFYDGGDGARLFRGWFDSELGFPCTFSRTRNGQMRCLPAGQVAVFSDATCAMPVWSATCPATLPPYVTAWVPGPASVAYALGERYTGAVHNTSGGVCLASYAKRGSFYGMGAEIPSERFVAAAINMVPIVDGWLNVRTLLGDDGASSVAVEINRQLVRIPWIYAFPPGTFVFLGSGRLRVPSYVDAQGQALAAMIDGDFLDAQADAPCHVERFADGLRCVPRTVPGLSEAGPYLDAGCATLLFEPRPKSPWLTTPPPSGALAWGWDCSVATAYRLGDAVTPTVVYFKGATCEARPARAGAVYRPAAPASDAPWAPVTERVD